MTPGKSIPQPRIVDSLLHWFAKNQRSLPWRKEYSPYQTWISEAMLQQTRTNTVLPYYERWMQRFPDIHSVAAAPEDDVLKHWEGMGYYSRARNIHKTARIVVERFAGVFPDDYDRIIELPGIGRYTAGAIMSLAFNREYPVVDGNVERVFARWFNLEKPVKTKVSQDFINTMAQALIPQGKARDFNQALMELGAVICVPKTPHCQNCPVRMFCASERLGVVAQRPVAGSRKSVVPIEVVLGVLVHRRRVLIQKRPDAGLMGGLWEFPGGKLQNGETPEQALRREFHEELQIDVDPIRKLAVIRHQYTSFRVILHCYLCRFHEHPQPVTLSAAVDCRWVTADELNEFPFPAANRKLITMLGDLNFAAVEG
jgi:A/G-specific adenine glycosylase